MTSESKGHFESELPIPILLSSNFMRGLRGGNTGRSGSSSNESL